LAESTVRILIVEDYGPFRQFIRSTLPKEVGPQAIFEASDGVQAIELARALRPDLILLDIGLPKLNGIDAARRIRQLAPQSRILFVSQESSVDLVQEAINVGASGYVVKTDAARELGMAVKAVLHGERFVGIRFAFHAFTEPSDDRAPQSDRRSKNCVPLQQEKERACRHEAGFYSDDEILLDSFTQFIVAALKAGNTVILHATASHRDSLRSRLQTYGLDMGAVIEGAVIEQERYISLDAADMLSTFMVNNLPDPVRFFKVTSDLIAGAVKAAKSEHRVAACGEIAPLLWAQGNAQAAIRLERLRGELAETYGVDTLCGYRRESFQRMADSHIFEEICKEHSTVHSR